MSARPTAARRAPPPRRRERRSTGPGTDSGELPTWCLAILVLLVVIPPLVVVPSAADPFRLPKRLLFEVLGLTSLAALALAGRFERNVAGASSPVRSRLGGLLVAGPLLLVACIGLFTSAHPERVREVLPSLAVAVVCLAGWAASLRPAELRRLLDWSLLPAAVLATVALGQATGVWQPFDFGERFYESRLSVTSLAGNSGDLAMALVLPILLAQDRLRRSWAQPGASWPGRSSSVALLALLVAGLVASQGISGVLAAGVASSVFWLVGTPRRTWTRLATSGLLVALTAVSLHPGLRQRVIDKTLAVFEGRWNEVLTYRLDGWRAARWMFEREPLHGVGLGAFPAHYADAKLALLDAGFEFGGSAIRSHFNHAHNEFFQVAAEMGALGLLALMAGLVWLARTLRRLFDADRPLAFAGLAGLAVLALAQFPFSIAVVAWPALLWIAWCVAGRGEKEDAT